MNDFIFHRKLFLFLLTETEEENPAKLIKANWQNKNESKENTNCANTMHDRKRSIAKRKS